MKNKVFNIDGHEFIPAHEVIKFELEGVKDEKEAPRTTEQ